MISASDILIRRALVLASVITVHTLCTVTVRNHTIHEGGGWKGRGIKVLQKTFQHTTCRIYRFSCAQANAQA